MANKSTPAINYAQSRAGLSYGDLKSKMLELAALKNGTYSAAEVNGDIPKPVGGDGASAAPWVPSANIRVPKAADLMIRSMNFATSRGNVDEKTSGQQLVQDYRKTDEFKTSITVSPPRYDQVGDRQVRRSLGEQITAAGKQFTVGRGGDKMTSNGYSA